MYRKQIVLLYYQSTARFTLFLVSNIREVYTVIEKSSLLNILFIVYITLYQNFLTRLNYYDFKLFCNFQIT